MKNNKFTTVLLIILIIVCTFQGCSITNMNSNIENLNMTLNQMENNLENLEYRVEDLESVAYGNIGMQMDYYYELKEVDLASGKLLVDYIVSLEHVTSDTRILIRVGKDSYELELNNQVFTGTVVYPMNKDAYETVMYRYEGDREEGYETLECLSAGNILMNTMSCKFDGFTAYGNEKLTLAGELYYGFKQSESIKEAHLVVGDTSTDIEVGAVGVEGTVPINVSEYVDASFEEEHAQIREVCLEFVTESGIIYQLYPYFSAGGCHVIHRGEESMDERYFINQNTWIVIKLPDGTVYEMNEY